MNFVILADFLKTNVRNQICSHLSEKASKGRFFGPISSKITLMKEKGRSKRKSEEEEKKRGEKAMVAF